MKKNFMKNLTKNLITLMVVFSFVLMGTNVASAKAVSTKSGSANSSRVAHATAIVGSGVSTPSFIHSDFDPNDDADVQIYFHTAGSATNITTTTATLTGSVNPGGANVTAEYLDPSGDVLSGASLIPVNYQINVQSFHLTGLTPHTNYTYRLRVSDGTHTDVRTISFTTLSGSINEDFNVSGSATNITTTSATLTGSANPNGGNVTAEFLNQSGTVLSGVVLMPVNYQISIPSFHLTGLTPHTSYTYRLRVSGGLISEHEETVSISFTTLSTSGNSGHGGGSSGGGSLTQTQTGGTCGITSIASNVTKTTATLNGIVSVSNSNTYFEYGTTQNLGLKTVSRNVSAGSSFSENLSGLKSDTTYYFRLVSNCQNGNATGGLSRLHTAGNVVKPVVSPKSGKTDATAEVKVNSLIQLKIENASEFIGKDEAINYVITYKNAGEDILKDPVLQITVPEGVSMIDTSEGSYSNDSHILTVFLKDLAKDAEGTINLDARLDSIPSGTEKLVSTAMLVYTNTDGVQENATAYVSNTIKKDDGNNFFGAAAALLGGLLPVSLTGWFVLALIVLVGILIARKYIVRKNTTVFANNNKPILPE